MVALLFLVEGRRHGAALTLTAAVLAKAVPVLCLAAFWRHWAPAGSRALAPVARPVAPPAPGMGAGRGGRRLPSVRRRRGGHVVGA